jgi:hypothetical protein
MAQARFYEVQGVPIPELAGAAADFFRRDNFDAGFYMDSTGRAILQIGKQQGARFLLGLAYSLTVVFTPQPDGKVLIELGGESWGDKIASGAIGAVLLPPLLITAAVGAWQQSELDNRFWGFLEGYIYNRTGRVVQWLEAIPYYNNQAQWPAPPPPPPPNFPGYQNAAYGYAPTNRPPAPYPYPAPVSPVNVVARRSAWFDPSNMQPVFDQQVGRMASWQAVMADGVINYQELNDQQDRVDKLQKKAEDMLETEAKVKLAEVLTEISKLEQLQRTALTKV